MTTDRMTLDARAFGFAAGAVAAMLYTVCALAVAVAPDATRVFFSTVMHLDLTGLASTLTWGAFFGGLLFWSIATGVAFAAAGAIYNAFIGRTTEPVHIGKTAHRTA